MTKLKIGKRVIVILTEEERTMLHKKAHDVSKGLCTALDPSSDTDQGNKLIRDGRSAAYDLLFLLP